MNRNKVRKGFKPPRRSTEVEGSAVTVAVDGVPSGPTGPSSRHRVVSNKKSLTKLDVGKKEELANLKSKELELDGEIKILEESGVKTDELQMIDLIFAVDHPLQWHRENLRMNRSHYSSLRFLGSRFITRVQENMGAGVYFNPFCEVNGKVVQYGVISTKKLEQDCKDWNHLYIAGRLHKPIVELVPCERKPTVDLIKKNREAALAAALIQHKNIVNKVDLYRSITELSYLGDTRMLFTENRNQVRNMVGPLMKEFDQIYTPLLKKFFACETSPTAIQQDVSPSALYVLLMTLPDPIQRKIVSMVRDPRFCDIEEILHVMAHWEHPDSYVRQAIKTTVRKSSWDQSVKGIFTAGVGRSVRYSLLKVGERFARPSKPPKVSNSTDAQPQPEVIIPVQIKTWGESLIEEAESDSRKNEDQMETERKTATKREDDVRESATNTSRKNKIISKEKVVDETLNHAGKGENVSANTAKDGKSVKLGKRLLLLNNENVVKKGKDEPEKVESESQTQTKANKADSNNVADDKITEINKSCESQSKVKSLTEREINNEKKQPPRAH